MINWLFQMLWECVGVVPLIGLVVAAWAALKVWKRSNKGPSPFGKEFICPKKPIVLDHKLRDAILKQPFKAKDLASAVYDAIVIGSGPSGLSTAVILSRMGWKVLVLEQHDTAGGTCHTFRDKGFEFNTGLHYLGTLGEANILRVYVDQLTRHRVGFNVLDDAFDTLAIVGKDSTRWYQVKSGLHRAISSTIQYFPEERAAIEEYYKVMMDSGGSFDVYIITLKLLPRWIVNVLNKLGLWSLIFKVCRKGYHKKVLGDFVDGLTDNRDLRILMTYICCDYGGCPKENAVLSHGCVINHFVNGSYYPIGGPSELVYQMCEEIQERGGQVLMSANVNRILFDSDGNARGVEVGNSKTQLYAPVIVSSAGISNTFQKLLPREIAEKSEMNSLFKDIGISNGFISLFVGLDGTSEELKLPAANVWALKEDFQGYDYALRKFPRTKYEDIDLENQGFLPSIYLSFGSAKDPISKLKMPGKSAMEVIILCNPQWFDEWKDERKGHRGQAYEDRKRVFMEAMWSSVLTLYPQLDGKALFMEIGTTNTNRYYLGSMSGELYGLNHSLERISPLMQAKLRPETGIPGLYLTGSDITAAGVVLCMFSGLLTASKITNKNLFVDLASFHKQYTDNKAI